MKKYQWNASSDVDTTETIVSDAAIEFITSATTIDIVSSDAADTKTGAWARKVIVHGLDDGFNEIEEEIELNGTTIVTTTNSFVAINCFHVTSVGTNGVPKGDITAKKHGASNLYASIPAGTNDANMGIFVVPDGKNMMIKGVTLSTSKANIVNMNLYINDDHCGSGVWHKELDIQGKIDTSNIIFQDPLVVDSRGAIKLTAKTKSGTDVISVIVHYEIVP